MLIQLIHKSDKGKETSDWKRGTRKFIENMTIKKTRSDSSHCVDDQQTGQAGSVLKSQEKCFALIN